MAQDNNLYDQIGSIISQIQNTFSNKTMKLHEIENVILKSVLDLGRNILENFIDNVVSDFNIENFLCNNVTYSNKGKSKRKYTSVFGEIEIERLRFYSKSENIGVSPTDSLLSLPKSKTSYLLQEWLVESASNQNFERSCSMINKILGFNFRSTQVIRMSKNIEDTAENYYDNQQIELLNSDKDFACASFDGKGVPIKASEVDREVDSSAVRLSRGKKKGIKKEVTVSVNYNAQANIRSADQVIDSYFKTDQSSKESTQKNSRTKHLAAFLSNQNKAIQYGLEVFKSSAKENQKLIVLIDGAKGLEKSIDMKAKELGIEGRIQFKILDFIHATEYVWKVANSIMRETDKNREKWVKEICREMLLGNIHEIISRLKNIVNKKKYKNKYLSESKIKQINRTIKYFENHSHMMKYNKYLEVGTPISTGVVESACGYFIKLRFDCNGMRWTIKGAQNLINLRAINLNGNWSDFIKEHVKSEHEKLYSHIKMIA